MLLRLRLQLNLPRLSAIQLYMENDHKESHMNRQKSTQRLSSRRQREHEELLERALARPGIRDVVRVSEL